MRRGLTVSIGGGLAGGAFALELARHGWPVRVLERSGGAHHKVCGEFISRDTQLILQYLGLDAGELGGSAIGRLRLASGTRAVTTDLPFEAVGLSRHRLDSALLDAAATAGADISFDTNVTGLQPDGDLVAVHTGSHTIQAAIVALASGKHNVRGYGRPGDDNVAMKIQLDPSADARAHLDGLVQLCGYDGGYVGACLTEGGRLALGWLMSAPTVKGLGPDWLRHADHLARSSPHVARILEGGEPVSPLVAVARLPLGYLRSRPISSAVFPIGDQLAVIPSFTGDGMAIALSTGIAAAQAVLRGESAEMYQAERTRILRPQFRLAKAVNFLFETSPRRAVGLAAASLIPGMASTIVAATRLRGYERLLDRRGPR